MNKCETSKPAAILLQLGRFSLCRESYHNMDVKNRIIAALYCRYNIDMLDKRPITFMCYFSSPAVVPAAASASGVVPNTVTIAPPPPSEDNQAMSKGLHSRFLCVSPFIFSNNCRPRGLKKCMESNFHQPVV